MKITVKENRELIMVNARNTQNENDVLEIYARSNANGTWIFIYGLVIEEE